MKKSSLKKAALLAAILAVPVIAYYLLQEKGKNRYRPLSIFGPKQVAETFHKKRGKQIPDTIYHTVRDFQLTNQMGELISFPPTDTKLTVVAFFYTRCERRCSQINKHMAEIQRIYHKNKLIQLFSITVDPGFDTPEVLRKYAQSYQVRSNKWQFLTGQQAAIYKLVREDFLLDVLRDTTTHEANIHHSSLLILLDPQKRIRGYYDATEKEQVDRLVDEIRVLIAEELRGTNPIRL